MRTRPRTIASTAAVLLIGAFTVVTLFSNHGRKPEPLYNGRYLSEWLEICHAPAGPWDTGGGRELAVRSIGTNALPFLLEWMRYELPAPRKVLLRLATFRVPGKDLIEGKVVYGQSTILGRSTRLAELASFGFTILNTNAIPAISQLEKLMKDSRKPEVGLRAIYALGAIGGPAITALTNALADPNQTNRIEIMVALMGAERESPYHYGSAYTGASLPALNRALKDPDAEVRRQAAVTLYNITEVAPKLAREMRAPSPPP